MSARPFRADLGALSAIAAGGALGACARHGLAILFAGEGLVSATLVANGAGSFLIGFAAALLAGRAGAATTGFVLAGFCGGFTTFSLFSLETLMLLRAGEAGLAALHVAASLALWLVAVAAGHRLGRAARRA